MRAAASAIVLVALALGSFRPAPDTQQPAAVSRELFAEMRWRSIGPFRASRTRAAAGHPSHPYTFYMGVCNGGVWKTTDA